MAQRRRVVPDSSVLVAAHFREQLDLHGALVPITDWARPVVERIRTADVEAFAPELLRAEFLTAAQRKAAPRAAPVAVAWDQVSIQVERFRRLEHLVYIPGAELAERAWDLIHQHGLPPADAWFAACAIHCDAELWYTHEQEDNVVGLARQVPELRQRVFVLTQTPFWPLAEPSPP